MDRSRIPQFYKYSVLERLEILKERNLISTDDLKHSATVGARLQLKKRIRW